MHKITLINWHNKAELTIEINVDSYTNDMITVFKTMAQFLTFNTDFLDYNDNL